MRKNETRGIFIPLLSIAFIVLRLCEVITWPWVWVLAPLWVPWAVAFFVALWATIKKEERKKKWESQT